jgi:hypothetical protein
MRKSERYLYFAYCLSASFAMKVYAIMMMLPSLGFLFCSAEPNGLRVNVV